MINSQTHQLFRHQYRENGNSWDHWSCTRMLPHPCTNCKPNVTLEQCCILILYLKHQYPKTAVVRQNDQFSDSAYHRCPEPKPDIENGLHRLLICSPITPPKLDRKQPCLHSTALLVLFRFLHQISDKFWIISLSATFRSRMGTKMVVKIDPISAYLILEGISIGACEYKCGSGYTAALTHFCPWPSSNNW